LISVAGDKDKLSGLASTPHQLVRGGFCQPELGKRSDFQLQVRPEFLPFRRVPYVDQTLELSLEIGVRKNASQV
jgi:hypothetical protein